MKRLILLIPIVLVLLIGIGTVDAQRNTKPTSPQSGYDLSWYNIDGGGATFSIGGSYSRMVMVGQPDAGSLGGGSYTINGGFWGNALIDDNHYLPLALENF